MITKFDSVDWLERNLAHITGTPVRFDDDERAAIETYAVIGQIYNHRPIGGWGIGFTRISGGIRVVIGFELATFDSDQMTRLVIAAHDRGVDVTISPYRASDNPAQDAAIRADAAEDFGLVEENFSLHAAVITISSDPSAHPITINPWQIRISDAGDEVQTCVTNSHVSTLDASLDALVLEAHSKCTRIAVDSFSPGIDDDDDRRVVADLGAVSVELVNALMIRRTQRNPASRDILQGHPGIERVAILIDA